MKLTIYVEHRFAVLTDYYQLTIKANDNASLLVTYNHTSTAWQRKYETLEELIQDGDLLPLWKWIARGILGIPLEIKNEVIRFDELPQEFF
jgi:hypothetical protein